MTMSSIFNSGTSRTSFFSRSRSSPNIPDLAKTDPPKPSRPIKKADLPRAATYTHIPAALEQTQIKVTELDLDTADGNQDGGSAEEKREGRSSSKPGKEERPRMSSVGRRKSLVRPKSWIQKEKRSNERVDEAGLVASPPVKTEEVVQAVRPAQPKRRKSMSESIASFARKSWIGSSRSPSPTKSNNSSTTQLDENKSAHGRATSTADFTKNENLSHESHTGSPQRPQHEKRLSTFQKFKQRPQSVLLPFTNLASANSSTSSLHSSLENKSTPRTSVERVPPIPATFSTEKLLAGVEGHKKRDELAASFRSLDNDFQKFQSKSWSLKTNIVRSAVLPFLKNHASHPSNDQLRPEDLDKRVAVLNKWWGGLLEVLDGRQNQTVSGVDRPVLLEACYYIMTRPEWRASPSPYAPISKRTATNSSTPSLRTRKSSASVRTAGSQLLLESTVHNVRSLFVQNLLTQTAFVVDKMSLRHAPASLTTFCGKALAYAFFFVPGIADVLVRVWKLSSEALRRVTHEYGLGVRPNHEATLEAVAAFPAHLHDLGWSSPKAMFSKLHKNAELSGLASGMKWYGPWAARWCGRDSDLLFVFAKHYFILCEEFFSPEAPLLVKCRAPGFILLQAQMMIVLDGTTHRQHPGNAPVGLEDALGADAIAAAIPFPTNNTARPMAENRLIMLLRDFLSEHSSDSAMAQRTFAEVFSKTVQASAHRTSLFDHHACFVLCDFMEESVQIFVRYQVSNPAEPDRVDWFLWMKVCQQMLESHNTLTQIRLFAFLFSLWNTITSDSKRKQIIALDWLLSEGTFTKFFSHWCPMVRAYYMRLLCWRLCRDDGEASVLDTKIFSVVSNRLKSVYAHYLFAKQSAEHNNTQLPSTAPCNPAPGRRLLIIRNDFQAPAANVFLGFDGIVPPTATTTSTSMTFKRHSGIVTPVSDKPQGEENVGKDTRKRWSILGKTSSSLESGTHSAPATPSSSPPKDIEGVRRETANSRASRPSLQRAGSSATRTRSEPPSSYKIYCFKFSLEWSQHFDRNTHRNNNPMKIVSPRLPNPAQACISARVPGTGIEVRACDPGKSEVVKYGGRALAEWTVIVGECNNFVERRRMEGVPGLKFVEVPLLGVEGFRKFGG